MDTIDNKICDTIKNTKLAQRQEMSKFEIIKSMSMDELVDFLLGICNLNFRETALGYSCHKCRQKNNNKTPCNDDCLYSDKEMLKTWIADKGYDSWIDDLLGIQDR